MFSSVAPQMADELGQIREQGLFKKERVIASPQQASIVVADGTRVLNLCANNYLGLADDPRIIEAAKEALDQRGFGMASVRFICGTQDLHKQLEGRISEFLGTADTILYPSCFDANGGPVRDHPRRAGRGHQRRAEPRVHHRRDQALPGQAAAVQEPGHGRPGGPAEGVGRRPAPAHRDRRRVLDGRLRRAAARDLRPGRALRRDGDGRRLARGRLRRPDRPRHPRAARRHRPGGHRHRHPGQGARRGQRRLHQRPPGDRRPAAAAVPAVPVLQLGGARPWSGRR